MSIVYVKTDDRNIITAVESSDFLPNPTGWIRIDEDEGDRYRHAQSNYFPKSIITENGAYRYKHLGGRDWAERTAEEMAADIQPAAPAQPTLQERVEALEAATLELVLGGAE